MPNIEKMRVKFMKAKTFDEYKKLVIDKNGNYTGYPDVVFYIEETKECWVNGISYSGTDDITQLNKVLTDMINTKQETLVSGKNIKTINDKSIIVTDSSDTNISLTDIGVPNIDKTVLIDTYQTITGSKNFTNKNTFTEIEVSDKIVFTGNVGRYLYIPKPTLITNLNADYLGGIKHNLVQDNINKRLDASQSIPPNEVWIGPASGVTPAKATFRTLVENDIPNIDIAKVNGITEALAKKSNTGHTHTWQSLTNKPTTVAEAGLLDAITTSIFNKAVDTLIAEDTAIRKLIIDTCFTKDEANILRNSLIEVDNQIKTDLSTNYYNTTSIDKFLESIRKGYNDGDTALDTKFTQLIENINTNIGDINSSSINTIKGSNSINVERINDSATISNKLSASNNMLSIADDGLLVNGKLVYESSTGMLHLQNTGGTDIGEPVDLGLHQIIEDGKLVTEEGKSFIVLKFIGVEDEIKINVTKLIDVYTASDGIKQTDRVFSLDIHEDSKNAIVIKDGKISIRDILLELGNNNIEIDAIKETINTNKANILTNSENIYNITAVTIPAINKAIEQNTTDIKTNADNITANKNSIVETNKNVTANKNSIASINTKLDTIDTTLTDYNTRITTNASNISANKSSIETVTILANTNKTNISTNKTNIATNATGIATNKKDIADLTTKVNANTSGVATNKSNITKVESATDLVTKYVTTAKMSNGTKCTIEGDSLVIPATSGDKGDKGDKGDTGETGPRGPQGAKGDKGDKGDKGETGPAGKDGTNGKDGAKGDKGDTPVVKMDGYNIVIDGTSTNIRGPQGPKGDKGDTGETGPAGKDGIQGIQGEKGEKGDKGDTGTKGPEGPMGKSINIKGSLTNVSELPKTGETGDGYLINGTLYVYVGSGGSNGIWDNVGNIQGPAGKDGTNGTNGTSYYVHVKYGTSASGAGISDSPSGKTYFGVYTGTASSAPSSASSYKWAKFEGPQGPQGAKGEKGDKGDKGDTGAKGAQGIQGEKGEKGDTGPAGKDGTNGKDGAKGEKGDSPVVKMDGFNIVIDGTSTNIRGLQGAKGEKGDTGKDGGFNNITIYGHDVTSATTEIKDSISNINKITATSNGTIDVISSNFKVKGRVEAEEGFFQQSDEQIKKNIETIDSHSVKDIEIIKFNYKEDIYNKAHYGVIAQQVEALYPELVSVNNNSIKSVNYIELLLLMVNDLRKENKVIRDELTELKKIKKNN